MSSNVRQSPRSTTGTNSANEKNEQAEKRKVTVSDDDSGNRSTLVPSKRARVDLNVSKRSTMSPIYEETENPSKSLYPTPKDKLETNMDLSMGPLLEDDDEAQNNGTSETGEKIVNDQKGHDSEHFILPSPVNTNDESGKSKDEPDNGTESDSDSDKFFANIKAREEMQLQKKQKEEQEVLAAKAAAEARLHNITTGMPGTSTGGAFLPIHPKKVEPPYYKVGSDGQVISPTDGTKFSLSSDASASSPLGSEYMPLDAATVEIEMKVYYMNSRRLLFDTKDETIKTSFATVSAFLKHNGRSIVSGGAVSSSGYSGDISGTSASESHSVEFFPPKSVSRISSSTISTIPRASDASTVSRPSVVGEVTAIRKPSGFAKTTITKSGKMEPILSSTRIEGQPTQRNRTDKTAKPNSHENVDINSNTSGSYKTVISNGDPSQKDLKAGQQKVIPTSSGSSVGSKSTPKPKRGRPPKNLLSATSAESGSDSTFETPKTHLSKGRPKIDYSSSLNEDQSTESGSTSKEKNVSRRGQQSDDDDSESRSRPLSEAAKKSLVEFKDSSFVQSATLWGTIAADELVFARWRDRNYYSGVITGKGANDTWQIQYDDDMDDVASETHILPIKIIGVGTLGIYCPEGVYKPEDVVVVGSRVGIDKTARSVEYAVMSKSTGHVITCTRKNLTLRERDAKELRKNISTPVLGKAAEVSFDNIVSGPRRRLAAETLAPSDKIRRLIQEQAGSSGFDTSASDALMLKESSPAKNLSSSSSTGRRGSNTSSGSTSEKSADVMSLASTTPKAITSVKSTPTSSKEMNNSNSAEQGVKKGKKDKGLLDGMQFFMTASGGDPGGADVIPYDKDEYRELIENAGGSIVDVVGNEAKRSSKPAYLISDSYARTVKYIYSLAGGIPCVSHMWIQACLDQNKVVDWKHYQLESGWSLEGQRVIPAHGYRPLKDLKIYVTAESCDLYNYWKPVLTAAQANLLKPKTKKGPSFPPETDVLVTDATCPESVVREALKRDIPIVKPEWLVQTIILGKRADFKGHEKYRLDIDAKSLQEGTETTRWVDPKVRVVYKSYMLSCLVQAHVAITQYGFLTC